MKMEINQLKRQMKLKKIMMKMLNKSKLLYIFVVPLFVLAVAIGGCVVTSHLVNPVKTSLDFFADSIVSCDNYFINSNILLSDTVVSYSFEPIYTGTCESCKDGKYSILKGLPGKLVPEKKVKYNRKIIEEYTGFHSYESGVTIKVVISGVYVLKSMKELVVIKCTKRSGVDTIIKDVFILSKSGKVEGWCSDYYMLPH